MIDAYENEITKILFSTLIKNMPEKERKLAGNYSPKVYEDEE